MWKWKCREFQILETEQISSCQDGVSKENGSIEVLGNLHTEVSKPQERRKVHHPSSRSSTAGSSQQKPCNTIDKFMQPSSSIGSLDLQPSSLGRSGSSGIAGMTVPIRLDALSYLLNNALMGAYKMPPSPFYSGQYIPNMCQPCPVAQMGCTPYGSCMNQSHCSMSCNNQAAQPGYMMCYNQQGPQICQPQTSNYMPCMSNAATGSSTNQFPKPPQSGMTQYSPNPSFQQDNSVTFQQGINNWPKKSNDEFVTNMNKNSFSEGELNRASPQRRFGDSWSGRQQRDFGRGRGRADFAIRSWQGNTRSQDREWRFGDRSRNNEFSDKRGVGSPDRSPGRGQYSKRGRWSGGRDRGGENRDTWQQRNRQDDTPLWSDSFATQGRSSSCLDVNPQHQADKSDAGDEDWETDYTDERTSKLKTEESSTPSGLNSSTSVVSSLTSDYVTSKGIKSPQNQSSPKDFDLLKPTEVKAPKDEESAVEADKPQGTDFDKFLKGYISDMVCSKVDGNGDSSSEQVEVEEIEAKIPHEDDNPSTIVLPTEETVNRLQPVQSNEDVREKDVYTLVFSVESEENKEIVLELVEATDG
ncbi:Hypothetical predicted protein [Pelobates cultripes]|uniref:Uncharacterized protein n=1 Tax=Pelobates cultripes TaxID=61616 RepID=A0AAD1T9U4_PELCU|nr:Hypothetical predicted protein [Pelobates cultripes]